VLTALEYTLSFNNSAAVASRSLCSVTPLDVTFAPGETASQLFHFDGGEDRNGFNAHTSPLVVGSQGEKPS
jgi:hypothetical protein